MSGRLCFTTFIFLTQVQYADWCLIGTLSSDWMNNLNGPTRTLHHPIKEAHLEGWAGPSPPWLYGTLVLVLWCLIKVRVEEWVNLGYLIHFPHIGNFLLNTIGKIGLCHPCDALVSPSFWISLSLFHGIRICQALFFFRGPQPNGPFLSHFVQPFKSFKEHKTYIFIYTAAKTIVNLLWLSCCCPLFKRGDWWSQITFNILSLNKIHPPVC